MSDPNVVIFHVPTKTSYQILINIYIDDRTTHEVGNESVDVTIVA